MYDISFVVRSIWFMVCLRLEVNVCKNNFRVYLKFKIEDLSLKILDLEFIFKLLYTWLRVYDKPSYKLITNIFL